MKNLAHSTSFHAVEEIAPSNPGIKHSRAAVLETEGHRPLNSMLFSLLQETDTLVVIGYGGGEEGIMKLLDSTTVQLERLVVYWIMFEADQERLSSNATHLLGRDENKFLVTGMDADRFFKDLMNDLKIGVPRWIRTPTSVLKDLLDDFTMPGHQADPAIRLVLDRFQREIAEMPAERPEELAEGAAMLLKGDYPAALGVLEGGEPTLAKDRLRAMIKYDVAQTDLERPTMYGGDARGIAGQAELRAIVASFEEIVRAGDDEEKITTIRQLLPALISLHELTSEDALIERVVAHCDMALAMDLSRDPDARTELTLRRALALQVLGERRGDQASLVDALETYERVEEERALLRDAAWSEAKTGVATIRQTLGELRRDPGLIRQAISALHGLLLQSHGRIDPMTEAARRFNLAGALRSIAEVDPPSARQALSEAQSEAARVIELYGEAADGGLGAAMHLLEEIGRQIQALPN